MNLTKQTAQQRENTIFTREEVTNSGCCFTIFSQQKDVSILPRNRSEPKSKKIDLVTSKRGRTMDKDIRQAVSESLKAKPFSFQEHRKQEGHSSQTSKTTTQKNSLKSSKIQLAPEGKSTKLTLTDRYQKYLSSNNQSTHKHIEITFNQTRSDNSNIQYLSQISLVQEQFMSFQSNTWRALNILPSQQIEEFKNHQESRATGKFQMELLQNKSATKGSETPNPLQRLLQKKKFSKPEKSKLKLVL